MEEIDRAHHFDACSFRRLSRGFANRGCLRHRPIRFAHRHARPFQLETVHCEPESRSQADIGVGVFSYCSGYLVRSYCHSAAHHFHKHKKGLQGLFGVGLSDAKW
jgi:hypothetical protein